MLGKFYTLKIKVNALYYKVFIRLRCPSVIVGRNLIVFGRLLLSIHKDAKVIFGNNVVFRSATKYNYVLVNNRVSIVVDSNAEFSIGDNTGFSGTSIFVAKQIKIGSNCHFGGDTAIYDTDFHPLNYEARRIHKIEQIKSSPIIIGDDVFVGAHSIILKGVTIGNRAIIGAGSIVTRNIPAGEVWAGNPARFIKVIE